MPRLALDRGLERSGERAITTAEVVAHHRVIVGEADHRAVIEDGKIDEVALGPIEVSPGRAFVIADRRGVGNFGTLSAYGIVTWKTLVLQLLGFRRLRERDFYRDDPLVQRVLGLHRLPDVSTWTRGLGEMTPDDVTGFRGLNRELVTDRICEEQIRRVTVDFDGSVLSTRGHAEGSAIGYNRNRKGARSYYPLFCTIAQTGQFLDLLHRPGNVHDSRDALAFIEANIEVVRAIVGVREIETRIHLASNIRPFVWMARGIIFMSLEVAKTASNGHL
jgi:hypothetical protein